MNEIQLIEEEKHALQLCEKLPISFLSSEMCYFTIAYFVEMRHGALL